VQNPIGTCLGCRQTDDHPKHLVVVGPSHEHVSWHYDCHAIANPPCPLCVDVLALREEDDNGIGEEMRAHLTSAETRAFIADHACDWEV